MKEHEKAKAWLQRLDMTEAALAERTGWSRAAVYWFMRGRMAPGRSGENPRDLNRYSWQRFKLTCAAVEQQIKTGEEFKW